MATGKITKRTVDALKPTNRDQLLWDTERKGFGIKCTPTGKLVYLIQYRMHGGRAAKVQRFTIGQHGVWTPDSAGKEAERLLRLVAQGTDPAVEKKRARQVASDLAFNSYAGQFLDQFVKREWKDRSHQFAKAMVTRHLIPHFGSTPLPSITRADVVALLDKIEQPAVRRNAFAVLSRLFSWAMERESDKVLSTSPLANMKAPPAVESRDRVLDDDELPVLWKATAKLPAPFGSFVRLLLLSGQRRNEVAGMDWKEVNRDRAEWLIPGARTKNGAENLLPLSPQAVAELDQLAGGDKWPRRGLILTTTGATAISGFSKAKKALDAAMLTTMQEEDPHAVLEPWRLHDLRRTMATDMQRLGVSGDVIEACENRLAGKSKTGSARVYQRHDFGPEKRKAMDKWGSFVASIVDMPDNVVPLAKAG